MDLISKSLLDSTTTAARAAPRQRMNHNFHATPDHPCNRLLNAIEPGSYVRPHCHAAPEKDETMLILRGALGLITFDAQGAIVHALRLAAGEQNFGVTLAAGEWHTVISLTPGTVFFEAKAGPYLPLAASEFAAWAPQEGTPEAASLLLRWRALFKGTSE